jgi:hypothetical protein
LLRTLKAHGVGKFIAYELPLETVAARYGGHFQVVLNDARDSDCSTLMATAPSGSSGFPSWVRRSCMTTSTRIGQRRQPEGTDVL